jgi:dynein heavy chain
VWHAPAAGERWARTVETLRQNYDVLTGDMLLAAAFVSYAGPFTSKFRSGLIKEWIKFLSDKNAPMTEGITGVLAGARDKDKIGC